MGSPFQAIKTAMGKQPDVPRQFFDSAMRMIDEAADTCKKSGEALNIAVDALCIMREWGEPFSSEAKIALGKIADKLAEIKK